jgi:hypothetical protein
MENTMRKFLTSVAILASLSGTAVADQISWDAGFGASTQGGVQVPAINEMVFAYNSQSLVTDNGDGVLSIGDTIQSYGGYGANGFNLLPTPLSALGLGTIGNNNIGSFVPNPFPTMDAYGTDFVYNAGTLQFGVMSFNAVNTGLTAGFHNLFDLNVSTGGPQNVAGQAKQVFTGTVDNFANGAGSDFSLRDKTMDEWAALGDIRWSTNQTVSAGFAGFPSAPLDIVFENGVAVLAANHTGRLSIDVPEPTTLAILGLGLLGFAGARRRNS